jgi:mono/diheme cytochrome c family protein
MSTGTHANARSEKAMTSDERKGAASVRRPGGRFKRFAAYLVILIAAGIGAFAAFAWQPSIPEGPTPTAASFSPTLVQQGARLAAAGFCASCHSIAGGKPLGGGYAMKTGFGTIYSTNISPDRKTGIGTWTEEAFHRAMREGVARDGSHLFPAFPYDHFTRLSDEDIHALYAFIMTRPPVDEPDHANEMPFPFGIRSLQAGWKLLYFHPQRFVPENEKSPLWNRGAYLAESLSHCSACHTPRGPLGQELTKRLYQGASVDGWFAPALTASNPSPIPWTSDELHKYLTTGVSKYHGTAAGPMATVSRGLADVTPEDQRALVTYIESLGSGDARTEKIAPAVAAALAADAQDHARIRDAGGRLFVAACASCHYNHAPDVNPNRPELGLNSAVYLDDPSNLIHVILGGISAKDGAPGIVMPGFARGMTDEDVALLASYLRTTRTDKAPWPNLARQVAQIRAEGQGEKQ